MTGRAGNNDGQENVDATFAEIVAGLERDGVGTRWPEDQPATGQEAAESATAGAGDEARPAEPAAATWRGSDKDWDWTLGSEDEHYVPPEPPPFPKLRPATLAAVVLLLIGVFLLAVPGLIGLDPRVATPLALIALTSGVGWLVLRMRQGPPSNHDHTNGAQL